MKHLYNTWKILFLVSLTSVFSSQLFAQESPFKSEDILIEIYAGSPLAETFDPDLFIINNESTLFGLRLEAIMNNVVGFGVEFSTAGFEMQSNSYYSQNSEDYNFTIYRIIPRVDLHIMKTKKFDFSASIGFGAYFTKGNFPEFNGGRNNYTADISPVEVILSEVIDEYSVRLAFNGKYFIKENFALSFGMGVGNGYIMNGGLVYKISMK